MRNDAILTFFSERCRKACKNALSAVLAGLLSISWSAEGWAQAGRRDFMPLSELKPGMKGVGRTVFEGDKVDEFQVEILGVLENIAPKQSAILA
ncbi:MAG: hypothetical protein L0312_13775, partial [Acidobacteria bacterium]|nr:hypothetical protein [Acidobacteriota bacterium]